MPVSDPPLSAGLLRLGLAYLSTQFTRDASLSKNLMTSKAAMAAVIKRSFRRAYRSVRVSNNDRGQLGLSHAFTNRWPHEAIGDLCEAVDNGCVAALGAALSFPIRLGVLITGASAATTSGAV